MFYDILYILASAYTQVIILALLLAYFFTHRRDPHLLTSGLTLLRVIFLVVFFLYFLWNWSSEIPPSLRNTSVLGMFLINLFLLNNIVLNRLSQPYRQALQAYGQEPSNQVHLDKIWRTGKRFYYARYFLSSLFSGASPSHFLHSLTNERVRADIQKASAHSGSPQQLITFKMLTNFLRDRLAQDKLLPPDLKKTIEQITAQFSQHAWIEKQANDFLTTALETPEKLPIPEGTELTEKTENST